MTAIFNIAVLALEAFGALVIVGGVLFAVATFVRDMSGRAREAAYRRLRANMGRGILLGLEVLIAADIVATITTDLTLESVAVLGVIVLIRTFLSLSLDEGRWPWQRRPKRSE